jgi:Protein of unknown function (DUF2891)
MDLAAEWLDRLRPEADGYARLALENIAREFPTLVSALMTAPGQFPDRPRDRTPVFYGSFDWHSCVEMHWVLVRLLKTHRNVVPADRIRAVLDAQLTPEGLRHEAEYAAMNGTGLRHYGWGWALTLSHELAAWTDDDDARRWAAALEPLAEALTAGDPRVPACAAAGRTHAEASLPNVVTDHYMVTHWLAAYAVLLFS